MDAIVQGNLVELQSGCVGLSVGAVEYLVVWPNGTEVIKSNPLQLSIQGTRVSAGDFVKGAGGTVDPATFPGLPDVPTDCVSAEISVMDRLE
ncbi:hypothetical protein [Aeromicrobium sp.]|uniref:hypothetical protein n=1 Tax=Aeromicrobium sp. TaxID=1871063 RepID=UPI002FCB9638